MQKSISSLFRAISGQFNTKEYEKFKSTAQLVHEKGWNEKITVSLLPERQFANLIPEDDISNIRIYVCNNLSLLGTSYIVGFSIHLEFHVVVFSKYVLIS
ncbi:MAG: hypothetical protein RL728_532 [Bacteroidota bacterium]|jgi:hypothetical protein